MENREIVDVLAKKYAEEHFEHCLPEYLDQIEIRQDAFKAGYVAAIGEDPFYCAKFHETGDNECFEQCTNCSAVKSSQPVKPL